MKAHLLKFIVASEVREVHVVGNDVKGFDERLRDFKHVRCSIGCSYKLLM